MVLRVQEGWKNTEPSPWRPEQLVYPSADRVPEFPDCVNTLTSRIGQPPIFRCYRETAHGVVAIHQIFAKPG